MQTIFSAKRWFFLRTEIDRLLTLSIFFSFLMVAGGMIYTGRFVFLFLIWNLFLAYIPYAITNFLQYHPDWIERKLRFVPAFIVWLLFIPNSFYILTDLFHLGEIHALPLWYDLVLLLSFAWNGLLLGIVSVRQMEKIVTFTWKPVRIWLFVYPIMWLNALGIYIGRYMRYNSWDVLTDPFHLLADIGNMLLHPIEYRFAWGMVFCFSIFMTIIYTVLKRLARVIP
ncbi:MAG: DUF1361 domain-containing protein [Chitinophagaceae bacterium]|nr:DUF1361 domain-containing protein [Chitinophagaceae bacterium]